MPDSSFSSLSKLYADSLAGEVARPIAQGLGAAVDSTLKGSTTAQAISDNAMAVPMSEGRAGASFDDKMQLLDRVLALEANLAGEEANTEKDKLQTAMDLLDMAIPLMNTRMTSSGNTAQTKIGALRGALESRVNNKLAQQAVSKLPTLNKNLNNAAYQFATFINTGDTTNPTMPGELKNILVELEAKDSSGGTSAALLKEIANLTDGDDNAKEVARWIDNAVALAGKKHERKELFKHMGRGESGEYFKATEADLTAQKAYTDEQIDGMLTEIQSQYGAGIPPEVMNLITTATGVISKSITPETNLDSVADTSDVQEALSGAKGVVKERMQDPDDIADFLDKIDSGTASSPIQSEKIAQALADDKKFGEFLATQNVKPGTPEALRWAKKMLGKEGRRDRLKGKKIADIGYRMARQSGKLGKVEPDSDKAASILRRMEASTERAAKVAGRRERGTPMGDVLTGHYDIDAPGVRGTPGSAAAAVAREDAAKAAGAEQSGEPTSATGEKKKMTKDEKIAFGAGIFSDAAGAVGKAFADSGSQDDERDHTSRGRAPRGSSARKSQSNEARGEAVKKFLRSAIKKEEEQQNAR